MTFDDITGDGRLWAVRNEGNEDNELYPSNVNLDTFFRPLSNHTQETYLEKEKAKISKRRGHASWLRIYAIKLNRGIFIITGGAIKLSATMQEREHTAKELVKMERTRRFLIDNGIVDENGFEDYLNEIEI
jgi:hypothetical protein